jgi:outer membrane lipoprotein-sorting protein
VKLALLALLAPAIAMATPAVLKLTPAQTLAKVEATYRDAKQISGAFAQTETNKTFGTVKTSAGTFAIVRPDKLRLDYVRSDKLDRAFIFDGKTLWIDEPRNSEVKMTPATSSDLPTTLAFLTGTGTLAKAFTVAAPKDANDLVPGAIVLELVPKQPSASYTRLQLVVDPTSWTVTRSLVTAASGNTTSFQLTKIDLAAKLDAKRFTWVLAEHPNYKVTK